MTDTHGTVTHATSGQKHPYHLVEPSIWPVVTAVSAGTLAAGLILYAHHYAAWVLPIGVVMTLASMGLWWRDVVKEATFQHLHTKVVQLGLRYGMLLFIASEVMFFVAFFWAYFSSSLNPKEATGGIWPPKGILTFDPFEIPLLNTLVLLTSGVTVTWAHHALREGDRKGMLQGLALTILLGLSFTGLQFYEYRHAAFGFREGIYPSTFFMATGFHGFHVIVGTIFLCVCWFRANRGDFKPDHHFGFEAAAWYWHFVDVVWLFLFVSIYIGGAGPTGE